LQNWSCPPNLQGMTVVLYFDGVMPHTRNRWPALLRSMDGVKAIGMPDDGQGNSDLRFVLDDYPDHTPVYVVADTAAHGALQLDTFQHPEKALYVFGPDHGFIAPPEGAVRVTIFMSRSDRSIFSDHAGAMVLYHRRTQRGTWT